MSFPLTGIYKYNLPAGFVEVYLQGNKFGGNDFKTRGG